MLRGNQRHPAAENTEMRPLLRNIRRWERLRGGLYGDEPTAPYKPPLRQHKRRKIRSIGIISVFSAARNCEIQCYSVSTTGATVAALRRLR